MGTVYVEKSIKKSLFVNNMSKMNRIFKENIKK